MAPQVHVIGASGRSGSALCRSLLADGISYVPLVRDSAKWTAMEHGIVTPRVADLADAARLRAALADATRIVSCAHARHTPAVLAAAPAEARLVLLGSTRKFTRWPDAHGNGVLRGEASFLASGRSGVMLHPTMIYGAQGEDNVQRLATLLCRLPFVPLPGGGTAMVQPIHQDDVTRAIRAALDRVWEGAHSLVIAGPAPLPYADFVRAVAAASGQREPRILGTSRRLADGARRHSAVHPGPAADRPRRNPPPDGRQELRCKSNDRNAGVHAYAAARRPRAHVHVKELRRTCRSSTASPNSTAR